MAESSGLLRQEIDTNEVEKDRMGTFSLQYIRFHFFLFFFLASSLEPPGVFGSAQRSWCILFIKYGRELVQKSHFRLFMYLPKVLLKEYPSVLLPT